MGTIVIVLLIVLLLFSDRLAGAGKGLGEAVKNFKRAAKADGDGPAPAPAPVIEPAPRKLLPARGETTPEDRMARTDETNERKA